MKRILGISGSMKKDKFSSTEYLLECALNEAERCGASTKHIRLVDYNILPCTGCGECMNGNKCKLLSNPTDQLKELYDECCKADAFIFASPVYALSLPAIWKCWFDRCEPCSESDLDYDYYCYDVVKQVKGKAFRGKVAAQIIVSAGSGAEWAISALAPAFTAVQLSIIASAGISLIEFDAQPGIKKHNWSKDISKADFAINIAKSIGQRVAQTIGYSTYKIDATNRAKVIDETLILDQILENGCREKIRIGSIKSNRILFIASTKKTAKDAYNIYCGLRKTFSNKIIQAVFNLSLIDQLPHFISKDDIVSNLLSSFSQNEYENILFDWNMQFYRSFFDENLDKPRLIIYDSVNKKVIFNNVIEQNNNEYNEVLKLLEGEED